MDKQTIIRETRKIFTEEARLRKIVEPLLLERGLSIDWRSDRYRGLHRRIAREKAARNRQQLIGAILAFAGILVGNGLIVLYLKGPESAFGYFALGYLGVMFVVAIPSIGVYSKFRIVRSVTGYFGLVYYVGIVIGAGIIVYGRFEGGGPMYTTVQNLYSRSWWGYALVHGALFVAVTLAAVLVLSPLLIWINHRRRYLLNPTAKTIRLLFRCIESIQSEQTFLNPSTRTKLIPLLNEVAVILRRGMWREEGRPTSLLARSMLKQRCVQAGDAVEMLTVWVALPAKTTQGDLLKILCTIVVALVSGRFDELPVEPKKVTASLWSVARLVLGSMRTVLVGAAPLGMVYVLQRFDFTLPDSFRDSVYVAATLWLVVSLITVLEDVQPSRAGLFMSLFGGFMHGRGK